MSLPRLRLLSLIILRRVYPQAAKALLIIAFIQYHGRWQDPTSQDKVNRHQDSTVNSKGPYSHNRREARGKECHGRRARRHEHSSRRSSHRVRHPAPVVFLHTFVLSTLVPRIEKDEEIICGYSQYYEDGKIV